jgi:anaerobic selenocysteine-containing dehydrogenase
MMPEVKTVRGACPHDCPDTCAWEVTVEVGRATRLVGVADHPFTQGGLCAKVNHYLDRVYGPERLLHPLRRVGAKGEGRFERVGWEEAIDDIARRLKTIIAEDGGQAVLPYSYMGTQGLVQGSSIDRRFFARLGATRLERAICANTGSAGAFATLGTNIGILPQDIAHARFIVLWGTNTVVTNLHLWRFIRQARDAGATVVVVDPVRTHTAESADWHVRPLPGTDAALALGMMHVIVAEGLHDSDYVDRYTTGFEQLQARLAEYPPEVAARLTGLETEEIVRLARAYASGSPSLIRTLVGMEHRAHGGMAFRTISCLPALTGAWRHRGGGLLFLTAGLHFDALNAAALEMPELEDSSLRSVNMVQLGRALTDPAMKPPIRALIVHSSNPAAIAPSQNLVLEGLRREDLFTVVHEQLLTDTARHADYVLPATTQVEHLDLVWSWGHDYLTLNRPAIDPVGEAIPNTELFRRLAAAMGFTEDYFGDSDLDLVQLALASDHPHLEGITFEQLLRDGWARLRLPAGWMPFAEGGFPTPSGRCEFYSEQLASWGQDPLPTFEPSPESAAGNPELAARFPLSLITGKSALHFLNSSYAGLERHRRAEVEPRLDLAPADAAARGVADGEMVRVHNDRGSVTLRARVGDRVRPGVCAMPSGWWASLSQGGSSANVLTRDGLADIGGGGDFHDTLVEVTPGG